MKKYVSIIIFSLISLQVSAWDANTLFWEDKVNTELNAGWNDFVFIVDNMFWYLLWLLYFVAIVFAIYGWFMILTSWGDDERVKKWKNIVIYMVLWLIVIFLWSIIVNWIIDLMSSKEIVW